MSIDKMHISRADLNLFVIFETIYSHGGVTKAADTLNLTQPTISHALGRLRKQMDDPLFIRHGQKLMPTDMARKMIVPIREALAIFERTLGEAENFNPRTAEIQFSIGLRSLMEHSFFLPLVLAMHKQAPHSTISSAHYERNSLEADLTSGKLNAATDLFLPLSNAIQRKLISQTRSVIVARQGHPVFDNEIDLKSYLELDHVIVTSRRQGMGPEDSVLSRLGKSRNIVIRCQQINTAMRIVNSSNIILTMAETFARRANVSFNNKIVPTPFEANQIDTYLYWHSNSHEDQANKWFRNLIEQVVTSNHQSYPKRVT